MQHDADSNPQIRIFSTNVDAQLCFSGAREVTDGNRSARSRSSPLDSRLVVFLPSLIADSQ